MRAADWPEELPPASPPPAARRGAGAGTRAEAADPGHLMTDEEWRAVRRRAEQLEDDDAG